MSSFKPGMMEWHTSECDMTFKHTDKRNGDKVYWCNTHNQWAYESPIKIEFIYADGTTFSKTN